MCFYFLFLLQKDLRRQCFEKHLLKDILSYIKDEYQQRRNIVVNAIDSISQLSCITPKATFYCFVNISKTGLNSEEFAYKLLEQKHVAVVPGVAYGKEYNDYVRIAFTLKREVLKEAMKRIKDFCEEC